MDIKKISQQSWFILTIIYIFGLLVRLIAFVVLSWNRGPHYEYYQIAEFIVQGNGYWWDWEGWVSPQPTALMPPIYTYFLAVFISSFSNPVRIIYFAQCLLNALGIIPSYFLGKQLVDKKTGIMAASLYAFFPEMVVMPAKFISEALFLPCIILAFYFFIFLKARLLIRRSYKSFFWLGVFMGLTTLIKTTGSLVTLAFLLSLLLIKERRKLAWLSIIFLMTGFIVATSPWNIRNLLVMKKPLIFTSNFGFNLWRGNHPWGSGTGYLDQKRFSEAELPQEYLDYLEKGRPKVEIEMDEFFLDEAIRFIKQNPSRYIKLVLKRMFYFLTIDPTHPLTGNFFYIAGYIWVVIFGIWGFILLRRSGPIEPSFMIAPILIFCFYVPIIIVPRFRLIMVLILLMLSALPATSILMTNKHIRKFLIRFG
jgi:4-amino-4-deoxy-L-arabinose transferase-like glycosyltransferase